MTQDELLLKLRDMCERWDNQSIWEAQNIQYGLALDACCEELWEFISLYISDLRLLNVDKK